MKRHQTDTVSLVFAVIFTGVVAWWIVSRFTSFTPAGFGLMVAGTLIAAGGIGLISALRPRRTPEPVAAVPTPGLFAPAPDATATIEAPNPAEAPTFSGFDVHGLLSEEERARADELIRKIGGSAPEEPYEVGYRPATPDEELHGREERPGGEPAADEDLRDDDHPGRAAATPVEDDDRPADGSTAPGEDQRGHEDRPR